MTKEVAGLPGDHIAIHHEHVFINDMKVSPFRIAATDSQNRPLPPSLFKPGIIPAGQALMLSGHHTGSFDSRYFGLVSLDAAVPVASCFHLLREKIT